MKKYIYASLFAAVLMTATSCSEDREGTEPGNDSKANVCIYQYTPSDDDGDYDADNDVKIRVAANSTATEVYVASIKDGSSLSEDELTSKALAGQKVTLETQADGAKTADLFFTGLKGSNTIAAVAVGPKGETCLASTDFFGIEWQDLCEGRVYSCWAKGTTAAGWTEAKMLQQRADKPEVYRVKNVYGKGNHVFITAVDEGGNTDMCSYFGDSNPYKMFTLEAALPYTYGSYGQVSIHDFASYDGDDSELIYNCLFDDYAIYSRVYYTVSAGYITYGWWEFIPVD